MATAAQKAKQKRLDKKSKFSTRPFNRCQKCGRPRGYKRMFKLCRICLREEALKGNVPGLKKSSW